MESHENQEHSVPESDAKPKATAAAPPKRRGGTWGRTRLTLVGSLRGAGILVWSGGAIPAAYGLDIFANGDHRTASGSLEGDFAALATAHAALEEPATDVVLKLEDGRELAVDLIDLEPDVSDFEAVGDLSTLAPA